MNKAKAAVESFTNRKGHTTEVDEHVRPAVTSETIKPKQHEETTQAIDREVHQDHHHTTVQPIQHQEVLPEKHHHHTAKVEERTFSHGDEHETRQRLEDEAGQFKNTSRTHETTQSSSQGQTAQGEHVHHHVHETVQPVIHKETIQPEVVHKTVPIHEIHQATSQHHGTSTLPTKTLDEFQSGGGELGGGTSRTHETYQGVPRKYNESMMSNPTEADLKPDQTGVEGPGSHHTGGTGASGSEPFTDINEGHRVTHNNHGTGHHGSNMDQTSGRYEQSSDMSRDDQSGTRQKASLMDKLNPTKDATGDGEKGFMK